MSYHPESLISLAHTLENWIFFCLGPAPPDIARRLSQRTDRTDVVIKELPKFQGKFTSERDRDNFFMTGEIWDIEDEARREKKKTILVADLRTLQICYALMRDWCGSYADLIDLPFDQELVPLIE